MRSSALSNQLPVLPLYPKLLTAGFASQPAEAAPQASELNSGVYKTDEFRMYSFKASVAI